MAPDLISTFYIPLQTGLNLCPANSVFKSCFFMMLSWKLHPISNAPRTGHPLRPPACYTSGTSGARTCLAVATASLVVASALRFDMLHHRGKYLRLIQSASASLRARSAASAHIQELTSPLLLSSMPYASTKLHSDTDACLQT